MDPKIFWALNEAYQAGVYHQVDEDVLNEEELLDIQKWVEDLIAEGYDLDDFTDEELYEAYLDEVKGFGGYVPPSGTDYAPVYKKPVSHERTDSPASRRGRTARQFYRGTPGVSGPINNTYASQGVRSRTSNDDRQMQPDVRTRDTVGPRDAGQPSGLMMSPNQRAELAAKRAERQGQGKRANKIRARMGLGEQFDLYDVISDFLVAEGYCDNYQDADVIMANMSEEWRDEILDEVASKTIMQVKRGGEQVYGRSPNLTRIDTALSRLKQSKKEKEEELKNRKNAAQYDQALRAGINRANNRSEPQDQYAGYGEIEALSPRADGGAHSGRKRLERRASNR